MCAKHVMSGLKQWCSQDNIGHTLPDAGFVRNRENPGEGAGWGHPSCSARGYGRAL